MRTRNMILTLTLSLLMTNLSFSGELKKYVIDKAHSSVEFTVRHMAIAKVKGKFTEFSGVIMADEEDVTNSKINITIQAKSINTENEGRDKHLRSSDFFDVEKYPEITFISKMIEKKGKNEYLVTGDFTMHGVTKEISFPFTILGVIKGPGEKNRVGIEAEYKLNRQDYGVSWSKVMDNGGLIVSNTVNIEINLELIEK